MTSISRRTLLSGGGALATCLIAPASRGQQRVILNDASRLNPTPVSKHWVVASQSEPMFIERLRSELKEAAAARRPVAVGAARHSMGGQSLPRDGTAITLASSHLSADLAARVYQVGAGARWRDVIASLDELGFSPAVMQSNHDFGVASTFAVNAHGWPVPYGPFGSTVRSIRMMLADGSILTCSRSSHPDLFAHSMGGYGLFGVILELELDMVQNLLLKPAFELLPTARFAQRFTSLVEAPNAPQMAYGRLSVARSGFLEEALIVTYHAVDEPPDRLPKAGSGGAVGSLSREIYRAQTGWETGKRVRWFAETIAGPAIASAHATRNTLLNDPVSALAGRDRRRTDILHEYFVHPDRLDAFVAVCQTVIPRSRQEFLNITLRYVAADDASTLSYAPTKRIAAVLSFSQEMTPEAEADMIQLTERLIDGVIAIGGSFYLPYRLHARRDQVRAAYRNVDHFLERKRYYDPGLLFRNHLWDTYFA